MAFTNHIKRLVDCFNSSIMVTEGCFNMYTHTQPISLGWLHYISKKYADTPHLYSCWAFNIKTFGINGFHSPC